MERDTRIDSPAIVITQMGKSAPVCNFENTGHLTGVIEPQGNRLGFQAFSPDALMEEQFSSLQTDTSIYGAVTPMVVAAIRRMIKALQESAWSGGDRTERNEQQDEIQKLIEIIPVYPDTWVGGSLKKREKKEITVRPGPGAIQPSVSIDDVLTILDLEFPRAVESIRNVCQLAEDDEDEPPVSLESVKNLAMFMLREARDKPEAHIAYYPGGFLSADWEVYEGLLSLIFLEDQSIRLVITSTPPLIKNIPDVDKRRGTITMHRDRIGCVFNCMFKTLTAAE